MMVKGICINTSWSDGAVDDVRKFTMIGMLAEV